jgi:hypothetical protein
VAFGDLLGREMGFADFITGRLPALGVRVIEPGLGSESLS